jgi:hypothetical protein
LDHIGCKAKALAGYSADSVQPDIHFGRGPKSISPCTARGIAIMTTQSSRRKYVLAAVTLVFALTGCSSEPTTSEPAPARTAIHRLFSQAFGDHLYGTDPGEGGQLGYVLEARNYFYLLAAPAAGHVPLYRCLTPQTHDHFLSTMLSCENATSEGPLGYIATSQVSGC